MRRKGTYHRSDGWRGYAIPAGAVMGVSCTGTWSDSPCPTDKVMAELKQAQKFLRSKGVHSRIKVSQSSNLFMVKIWLVVPTGEEAQGKRYAEEYLRDNANTHYIHDAE